MIVKRHAGFVELIPSPAEKKRELVGDNVLLLLANLNARLAQIEDRLGLDADGRSEFDDRLAQIDQELAANLALNEELRRRGEVHRPAVAEL